MASRHARRALIGAAALAAGAAAWVLATLPPRAVALAEPAPPPWPVARGAYHVHSTLSDGTGSIDEIAAAAARAGLAFVILTDHGDATRAAGPPEYRHGVLCIEAVEISADEGHYAALGLPPAPYPLGGEARDVAEDVARLGGFGIVAHPDSAKADLSWREWGVPFPAIEWLNADSQWRDETRWTLPAGLAHSLLRAPETVASLFDRPAALLQRWDTMSQTRRIVALAGHDAHQRLGMRDRGDPYGGSWYLRLPRYEALFRAFAIRVELNAPLARQAQADADAIVAAIRQGRVYTAIDAVAAPAVFAFDATVGESAARMGDAVPLTGPIRLRATSNAPPGASTFLLRNGAIIREFPGGQLEWAGQLPGVYRVEVRLPAAPGHPPVPWILSNPISVGQALATEVAASQPAAPPAPASWPRVEWAVEKAPTAGAALVANEPAPGEAAIHLAYRLGPSREASPYVAAVTRQIGPISTADRLIFRVAADKPMRATIQLRMKGTDPDARWRRSFYADATPRDVTVAWSDLRPVAPGRGKVIDVRAAESLLFVIDSRHTAAGAEGWITIDRLRTAR